MRNIWNTLKAIFSGSWIGGNPLIAYERVPLPEPDERAQRESLARANDFVNRVAMRQHPEIRALDAQIAKAKRNKKKWRHLEAKKQTLVNQWLAGALSNAKPELSK